MNMQIDRLNDRQIERLIKNGWIYKYGVKQIYIEKNYRYIQILKCIIVEWFCVFFKCYVVCMIGYGKVWFFLCMICFCMIQYVFVLYDIFLYVFRWFYGFCMIGFFFNKYIYCRVFNGYELYKFKEIYVY